MSRMARGARAWVAALLAVAGAAVVGCSRPAPENAETVVVVHGLGRTPASMWLLELRLESAGYRVVSFGYPSTSEPLELLVERLADEVAACCAQDPRRVHFVTHSMGGVMVWSHLARQPEPHLGRVVMLSPPSQGSELIDALADSPLVRLVVGPAGMELGTDSAGVASRLGPAAFTLGIIAGDRSMNPLASWLIPGPDDGKVGVERARAEGAADFLVLPATHTFIMNREDVAEETVHFLRTGRFGAGAAH
jgi:triacylglycerol lipase